MSDEQRSFGFTLRPGGDPYVTKRLKWWHIRKTKVRVITDVRLFEWGIGLESVFPVDPPKESA